MNRLNVTLTSIVISVVAAYASELHEPFVGLLDLRAQYSESTSQFVLPKPVPIYARASSDSPLIAIVRNQDQLLSQEVSSDEQAAIVFRHDPKGWVEVELPSKIHLGTLMTTDKSPRLVKDLGTSQFLKI